MIRLEAHGYRLTLAAEWGGTVLSLDWWHAAGWLPLLEPLVDPAAGMQAGCFIMAPFANRIADGRFFFAGQEYLLPINRPSEGMSIHGFARDKIWQVVAAAADHAHLHARLEDAALPWQCNLEQRVTLSPAGVEIALSVTNAGDQPMPFGFGLHPWFRKPERATLTFARPASLLRDARGLPRAEARMQPAFDRETASPLTCMPWFDGVFADWPIREALIRWPGEAAEIHLSATGALRHLHVYVPDDRPVFCAEPVSHLPDAVNRPDLAQMDVLAPGESLSGAMTLHATALTTAWAYPFNSAVQPEVFL